MTDPPLYRYPAREQAGLGVMQLLGPCAAPSSLAWTYQPAASTLSVACIRRKNKRLVALRSGLLASRGGYWGSLRAAMNPLFHTATLQGYNGVMNSCGGCAGMHGEVA